ncbi:MAG: 3-mercaptopyruvate sulfurtransferase [Pseudomonadota bacterium]
MVDFKNEPLVTTEWLAENLDAPDLRVIDATYFMPHEPLDARAEFEAQHIPGAVFFDIDDIADSDSDLPHMLPSPVKFSSRVRKLGLGDGLRFVVYDQKGVWSSPRVWWTFRYFGHHDVAVLEGGLPKWQQEDRPIADGPARSDERHFSPRMDSFMLREKDQMEANIKSGREQVIDARARGRFMGEDPEPREGLRKGHIPGSLNLPYNELFDAADGSMLSPEDLKARFEQAGLDMKGPVVTTCGSGITAAILALGLYRAGHRDVALYDGSWSEWGLPGDTAVATGLD